jgi:predicted transcriptional regulator
LACSVIETSTNTMTNKLTVAVAELSKEQLDLIEGFQTNYNAVDRFLRSQLQATNQTSFTALVNEYSRKHPGWRDSELLRLIAEVRNAIVHGRTEPYRYVAIPTPNLARELEVCRDRLIRPELAIPKFQRAVERVAVEDTLARVLRLVHTRDYSQFPVYDNERFRGLLTENGITRWLARNISDSLSLVELDDISVRQILRDQEKFKTWKFVSRGERVDDLVGHFATIPMLEAALITASGKESEKLLGIATRWDILRVV